MRALLLVAVLLLAGCAQTEPEAPAEGTVHVLVVGGNVVESGPEPENRAVCDVAAPPFSADADERKLWWFDADWADYNMDAPIFVIRVDRTDMVADDACWTPQLQTMAAADDIVWRYADLREYLAIESQEHHVIVGNQPLQEGDVHAWTIDKSCFCDPYYDNPGTYSYDGTLSVQYLGAWSRADIIQVQAYRDLPPLDVPYWNGY